MSITSDPGPTPIDNGADGRSKPAQVANQATSAAADVASTATSGAKDVAGEAATQAKVVAGEAKRQVGNVVDQTRRELTQQAEQRTSQAAGGLRTLSDQVAALADGRPGDAGPLAGYLDDARSRVSTIADRLDEGGAQGLLDDVTDFARRRPVVFLAAAGAAGFLVGRLARAGRAVQQDNADTTPSSETFYSATTSPSTPDALADPFAELPPPTPVVDGPLVTTVP
ncbi:MAG: hypothetical protein ABW219_00155 [Ilumatobacteraceae bacterium]